MTAANPAASANMGRWLDIARGLLEQPTAPLHERLPQAYIRAFAHERPNLKLSEDACGNLLLKYSAGKSARPPLVMVAHLDHPGFVISERDGANVQLEFRGGVGTAHARPGTRLQFFAPGNPSAVGEGELVEAQKPEQRLMSATAKINSGDAPSGGFTMWDFPGFSLKDGLIVTRCCDDLLGAAAALCTLDEIARLKPKGVSVWGLFTRAEEIGFLGALEAIRRKVVPKNACVLSLECSKAGGIAQQGEGIVVRVGDRASIFDPDLSEALRQAAENVKKTDSAFKYQRKLMDGGSCEATPFCALGYRASGLALPLGNYHNQALLSDGPAIGPETVNAEDFAGEVRLLVEMAQHPEWLKPNGKAPPWLGDLIKEARETLAPGEKTKPAKTKKKTLISVDRAIH